jgi:hypothetical protein
MEAGSTRSFSSIRSGTLHLAVAKAMMWLLFLTNPHGLREQVLVQIRDEADDAAEPDDRILYARTVAGGWAALSFVCGLAMVGLAFIGELLAGGSGRTVGLAAGLGATLFCVSGSLYASWRMLWGYRLRTIVRQYGSEHASFTRAARNATLRNRSIVGQLVVAALAGTLAAAG